MKLNLVMKSKLESTIVLHCQHNFKIIESIRWSYTDMWQMRWKYKSESHWTPWIFIIYHHYENTCAEGHCADTQKISFLWLIEFSFFPAVVRKEDNTVCWIEYLWTTWKAFCTDKTLQIFLAEMRLDKIFPVFKVIEVKKSHFSSYFWMTLQF